MELSGQNILVRAVKPEDIEQILAWGNTSEEIFFQLNFPLLFNRDDLAHELSHKDTELLMTVRKADQKPLGVMKIGPVKLPEKQTQLRFTVETYSDYAAPLALEAASLLIDQAFTKGGIHKVHAYTLEYEKEYESLLLKLGFKKEGAYQHHFFHKERYYAVNIFGLFKDNFLK